jgi:tetratricopeptide (TPR) repeat protein
MALVDSAAIYDPESPAVHFLRGLIFEQMRNLAEARNSYDIAYRLDSEYPGVRFYLGNVQFKFENYGDAIKLYGEAIEQYETGQGLSKSRIYLNLGAAYSRAGKRDSALYVYGQAIRDDSSNAEAYARIADEQKKSGDLEKALDYMRLACRFNSDNPEYQFELGTLYFQQGDVLNAIPSLKKTVEKIPWHYRAHFQLGQSLLRTGQQEEGQRHLAQADTLKERFSNIVRLEQNTEVEPSNAASWSRLGRAYADIGNYQDAKNALLNALSLHPGDLALQNDVAYICIYLNEYQQSISRFRSILKEDSTFIKAWLNLGLAYARSGRTSEAREAWQRVLSLEPRNEQALDFLAKTRGGN